MLPGKGSTYLEQQVVDNRTSWIHYVSAPNRQHRASCTFKAQYISLRCLSILSWKYDIILDNASITAFGSIENLFQFRGSEDSNDIYRSVQFAEANERLLASRLLELASRSFPKVTVCGSLLVCKALSAHTNTNEHDYIHKCKTHTERRK